MITTYRCVFSALRHFFLYRPWVFSSPLGLFGTQGVHPDPARKLGPYPRSAARALGVQTGKSPRGGILSTSSHPGPCKPTYRIPATRYILTWVKKMPDGSFDIFDLECGQCRQKLLGDGNVFPRSCDHY